MATDAADTQQSFGLSISPAAIAQSAVGTTECSQDYIEIIGGTTIANIIANPRINGDASLWCGRSFNPASAQGSDAVASVCTSLAPFKVRVNFDENEYFTNADPTIIDVAANGATGGEFAVRPGGIIGFSLCYATA